MTTRKGVTISELNLSTREFQVEIQVQPMLGGVRNVYKKVCSNL